MRRTVHHENPRYTSLSTSVRPTGHTAVRAYCGTNNNSDDVAMAVCGNNGITLSGPHKIAITGEGGGRDVDVGLAS